MSTAATIKAEIHVERNRQIAKGWTPEHDAEHGLWHLYREIRNRATNVIYRPDAPRRELIQIAALCIAAVEAIDNGVTNQGGAR